jgi:hypothetical protein
MFASWSLWAIVGSLGWLAAAIVAIVGIVLYNKMMNKKEAKARLLSK